MVNAQKLEAGKWNGWSGTGSSNFVRLLQKDSPHSRQDLKRSPRSSNFDSLRLFVMANTCPRTQGIHPRTGRQVGRCVPASLVRKPNLPSIRFGASDTPHGLQKEESLFERSSKVYSSWQALHFLRRKAPQPRIPEAAIPHPRMPGSAVRPDRSYFCNSSVKFLVCRSFFDTIVSCPQSVSCI